MKKLNCWEFTRCGREKAEGHDVCPAATEIKAHKVNGGTNGGRVCWAIARTCCSGQVQGTYNQKVTKCLKCEFRRKVREEEGYDSDSDILTLDVGALLFRMIPNS